LLETQICEEVIIWRDNNLLTNYNTAMISYMLSGTSTDNTSTPANANSITKSSDTTTSTPASSIVTSGSPSTLTFNEEMNTESIMTVTAFLQKAKNTNALKHIPAPRK